MKTGMGITNSLNLFVMDQNQSQDTIRIRAMSSEYSTLSLKKKRRVQSEKGGPVEGEGKNKRRLSGHLQRVGSKIQRGQQLTSTNFTNS